MGFSLQMPIQTVSRFRFRTRILTIQAWSALSILGLVRRVIYINVDLRTMGPDLYRASRENLNGLSECPEMENGLSGQRRSMNCTQTSLGFDADKRFIPCFAAMENVPLPSSNLVLIRYYHKRQNPSLCYDRMKVNHLHKNPQTSILFSLSHLP